MLNEFNSRKGLPGNPIILECSKCEGFYLLATNYQTKSSYRIIIKVFGGCAIYSSSERYNPDNIVAPPAARLFINVKFACHLVSPDFHCQVQILYSLGGVLVDTTK